MVVCIRTATSDAKGQKKTAVSMRIAHAVVFPKDCQGAAAGLALEREEQKVCVFMLREPQSVKERQEGGRKRAREMDAAFFYGST